jgi:peptidoglycan/xylan/chitin deacetylase (PgdA/CDA1 family)
MPRRADPPARRSLAVAAAGWLALLLVAVTTSAVVASDVIVHGSRERHWVALTFDDGWNVDRCARIANTLRSRGVMATFFPNGTYVRSAPSRWRSILRGFPVANHTYSHAWLDRLSASGIRSEITTNEAALERILGRPMLKLLRPPYGAYDGQVLDVAGALGYRLVLWDVDSGDTLTSSTSTVIDYATRGGDGSIVLLHCGPSVTPTALGSIIASYRARGFRFVDLATMLGLEPPAPAMACRVRNARSGVVKGNLQAAVRAASPGDRLVLRGTCRGTTSIGKPLSIRGTQNKRSRTPTLAGMDKGTVVTVRPGTRVSLTGVTIRGGAADRAAGIRNLGRLVLTDVVVRGNRAREAAGGIANKGHLELRGKTSIRGNTSRGHAGGVLNWGTLDIGYGSRVVGNEAATSGGGLFDRGTVQAPGCGRKIHHNSPDDCVGV